MTNIVGGTKVINSETESGSFIQISREQQQASDSEVFEDEIDKLFLFHGK
jgi:hypothetical protein